MKKTAQAAKYTRASILVRTGGALRAALFRTAHFTTWIAYFAWLLWPPIAWFSADPAHSHTATYWMGGFYLIAVGLMTWAGYIARVGFQRWNARGEIWAGWYAIGFSLFVLLAPILPLLGLMALLHNAPSSRRDNEYWWESNPLRNRKYGSAGNMGNWEL